jgi:hypothetical protein
MVLNSANDLTARPSNVSPLPSFPARHALSTRDRPADDNLLVSCSSLAVSQLTPSTAARERYWYRAQSYLIRTILTLKACCAAETDWIGK